MKIFVFVFFVINSLIYSQTIIHVPQDYAAIMVALNNANDYDTILVQAGEYDENIIWPNKKGLKLYSNSGPEITIIKPANFNYPTIMISTEVDTLTIISGFKIKNGDIAISVAGDASPQLKHLIIENNRTGIIFGLSNRTQNAKLSNLNILNNTENGIKLENTNNIFMDNIISHSNAVGINIGYAKGIDIINSTFNNNRGLGLYAAFSPSINISNSKFSYNKGEDVKQLTGGSHASAAGIYIVGGSFQAQNITVVNNTISNLSSYNSAGGICTNGATVNIDGCEILNNILICRHYGAGGFSNNGDIVTIKNFIIAGNTIHAKGSNFFGISGGIAGSPYHWSSINLINGVISDNLITGDIDFLGDYDRSLGSGLTSVMSS